MSNNRSNKRNNVGAGKLLLKKQEISRAQLDGVSGGNRSKDISEVVSAIGSGSSSFAETPVAAVTIPISAKLSAYDSEHAGQIKRGVEKGVKKGISGAKKVGGWLHKHLPSI